MNYAGRIVGSCDGNNNNAQQVLTLSLPQSACELRFRVWSQSSKNQFAYSFEPRYDNVEVIPSELQGTQNTDYRILAQSSASVLATPFVISEEIVIRNPKQLPERLNVLVYNTGTISPIYLDYQIIGGKNNGY